MSKALSWVQVLTDARDNATLLILHVKKLRPREKDGFV